jgi:hypothetical protein
MNIEIFCRCILFDGENISFDTSLVTYINSTNIPPIMIINRTYETQNLLPLQLVSFLVGLRTYQHPCKNYTCLWWLTNTFQWEKCFLLVSISSSYYVEPSILKEQIRATRYGAGRTGDRIPVEARFFTPVQTGPGAHPGSYKNGHRVFPGGKAGGA